MTFDEALREYVSRTTPKLVARFGEAAPDVPPADLLRDVEVLRSLARRYGAVVKWAAESLASEPEAAEVVMSAHNADVGVARRLAADEDHWLYHVLARAETCEPVDRSGVLPRN